jgi:hypothetical protein
MNPIFDELSYAENLLKNGFVNFMSMRDLKILSKYYFYIGHSDKQLVIDLQDFCKKFNPQYNEILAEEIIEKSIKYAKGEELKFPISIEVTKGEIEKIKSINNYKYEKILFCMLFVAKYNRKISEINNPDKIFEGRYYVNGTLSFVLSLARVYENKISQDKIKKYLKDLGYMVSNTNSGNALGGFELFYLDKEWNEDDVEFIITDLNNVVLAYPIYCSTCGKKLEKKSRKHDRCKECQKNKEYEAEKERRMIYMRNKRKSGDYPQAPL